MGIIGIVLAVLGSIAIAAFVLLGNRKRVNAREEIEAASTEHGWTFSEGTDETGWIRITTIADRNAAWTVEEHFSSTHDTASTTRDTTWTDPSVGIDSGLAVMSLAMDNKRGVGMDKFLGKMGNGVIEQHMVKTFFGAVGDGATDLQSVDIENAIGLVMATPDARDALIPIAHHEALEGRKIALPSETMPSVVLSPAGLQLKMKDTLRSGENLVEMVRLGQALSTALKAAPA